jgi:hypothetical protein
MDRKNLPAIFAEIDALPVPGSTLGDVLDILVKHGMDRNRALDLLFKAIRAEQEQAQRRRKVGFGAHILGLFL